MISASKGVGRSLMMACTVAIGLFASGAASAQKSELDVFKDALEQKPSAQTTRPNAKPKLRDEKPKKKAAAKSTAMDCATAQRVITATPLLRDQSRSRWKQASPGALLGDSSRAPICKFFVEQAATYAKEAQALQACPSLDASGAKRNEIGRQLPAIEKNYREFNCAQWLSAR